MEKNEQQPAAPIGSGDLVGHDHRCHCGTATYTPHEIGKAGCVRVITEPPKPDGNHETLDCPMWKVGGQRITDYTLKHQRGYSNHPCGCWSWWQSSVNSITA